MKVQFNRPRSSRLFTNILGACWFSSSSNKLDFVVLILFDPLLLDETKSAGGISEKRVLGTFSLMTRPKSKCVMLRSIGTSGGMRSPARVLSLLLELTPLYNVKLASSYAAWRGGGGGARPPISFTTRAARKGRAAKMTSYLPDVCLHHFTSTRRGTRPFWISDKAKIINCNYEALCS